MVHDVEAIFVKMTLSDEFGIYREYHQAIDNPQRFLLLSCSDRSEAIRLGGQIAALLNVRFRNELPKSEKDDDGATETVSTSQQPIVTGKPRRVSGIGPKIRASIREGLADQQIEDGLLDHYLAAGHTRESGLALLRPYIKELRKAK